jgi:hypothetical protein
MTMKRRDMIKLGALATAGVAGPSCAVPKKLGTLQGADGAAEFNRMLDEQLATLQKPGLLQRLVGEHTKKPLSAQASEKITAHDVMFRRMLSTVLVSQGFRELPMATQLEPAVQDRMWQHEDLIGSMVFEVSDMLAALNPDQRKHVQRTLKEQPDLPMALGELLDERSATVGMSKARRRQLRGVMKQASFRLREQDPSTLIDEYVTKVERLRPSTTNDGKSIDLAERLGQREFWRYQQHMKRQGAGAPPPGGQPGTAAPGAPPPAQPQNPMLAQLLANADDAANRRDCQQVVSIGNSIKDLDPAYYQQSYLTEPRFADCYRVLAENAARQQNPAYPPGAMGGPPQPMVQAPPPKSRAGVGGMKAGGWMLGIGVIVFLVSIPLVDAAEGLGLLGLTVGSLLFGIGLLVLLISAIIYAASD